MKLLEAEPSAPLDEAWHAILALLPPGPELERRARTTGAMRRRRGVKGAADLLRVALTYGFCGLSFKSASAWCQANRSGSLSKWGVLQRLKGCGPWLENLVAEKLGERVMPVPICGLTFKVVDATCIVQEGDKGETWRVHAVYDPWTGRLVDIRITGSEGGERLDRFPLNEGDLVVADRGYAHRRSLAHVVGSKAHFLIRTNWQMPLETESGSPFDLFEALRSLEGENPGEFDVLTSPDPRHGIPTTTCRLVAIRKSPEAAEAAKAKAIYESRKKGRTIDPRTLEACEYVMVLTSVPRDVLTKDHVLASYRLRWQIELEFKRLKSLLKLDVLRARSKKTTRAAIAAKLLGALLVEDLVSRATTGPSWVLTQLFGDVIRQAILGAEAVTHWLRNPLAPLAALREPPRKRQQQCLVTRALLLNHA